MFRLIHVLLLGLQLFVATALAGTLSKGEAEQLRNEVQTIADALDRGDAEPLIRRTHLSMQTLAGGTSAYATATRQYVSGLRESGLKVLSAEVGQPTETYVAGDELVCFVPRTTLLDLKGSKARSQSFFVAIRRNGSGNSWTFLDGASFRKHPEMLFQLLPSLTPFINLPPNQIEAM